MNTSKLKLAFATFLISSIFFSCKKEKENEGQCAISMSSLSGTYKLSSLTYKANANGPVQDYLAFMEPCEIDDEVTLSQNGTYNYKDKGTICTPINDGSGQWSLQGSTLISDGLLNGTISSFDCQKMVYHIDDLYTDGDKLIFVMTKQ